MLQSHFAETGIMLSYALVDIDQVGVLIDRWNDSNPEAMNDRRIVLSVDAVAFRPRVTIRSDGEIESLDSIKNLESPDLFDKYLLHPEQFTGFLREHWDHWEHCDHADISLFAFLIQPLLPDRPCCIIHAWPRTAGKRDLDVVERLLFLRDTLESNSGFEVLALTFDCDSAYSDLHRTFRGQYDP
jgi:hypothetical protein